MTDSRFVKQVKDFLDKPLTPYDERLYSAIIHLSGLTGIALPLVGYFAYRNRNTVIRKNAAEAANAQLTVAIFWFTYGVLWSIPIFNLVFAIPLLLLTLPAVALTIGLPIFAALKAMAGERFNYKIGLRIFS
jgi:uncharacterized Tic20 family protein